MTRNSWQELVPGSARYQRAAQTIFPYLIASLIYHEQYLRDNLDPNHPIFTVRVFARNTLLPELRRSTILAISTSPVTSLKATEIPPHLAIATRVNRIAEEISAMMKELKALPDSIASTVVNELRESFSINGVVPVCLRDIDSRLDTLNE
jgi:hypothetical protein